MNDLRKMLFRLWESACEDKPQRQSARVEDEHFVLTITGNQHRWNELCELNGVPAYAEQTDDGTTLQVRWPSHADRIFAPGGMLDQHLNNYEYRPAQMHLGRLVQRALEMNAAAFLEGATGTGKSFVYLCIALAMNKRVIVAAPTTALQMQLYRKDAPFLLSLPEFQGKRVEFAMGKNRYVCRLKTEDHQTGALAVNDPRFFAWYETTDTGNLEELEFALEHEDRKRIAIDDGCLGKMCARYADCFYYEAKARRQSADIIITNHTLLALHEMYPGAGILPDNVDLLVVDEAHQLPRYVMSALGTEFTPTGVQLALRQAENAGADTVEATLAADLFEGEMFGFVRSRHEREIGVLPHHTFETGLRLSAALREAAEEVWPDGALPSETHEILAARTARGVRSMADNVRRFAEPTRDNHVRVVKNEDRGLTFQDIPFDVSAFIAGLHGVETTREVTIDHTRCTRCGRSLTAEKVAVLDGKPYGPVCIDAVDVLGDAEVWDLAEWLSMDHPKPAVHKTDGTKPVVFTSATLAAPDMSAFMRKCGIDDGMQMVTASPFGFAENALLFVPDTHAPAPNNGDREEHTAYVISTMRQLVGHAQGGAFLLFTSNVVMRAAADVLRYEFEDRGWPVYVQGELPKLEIVRRFKEHGSAVLFATKTFWEGVDVQGEGLRLVVIDKLPFEAPNPVNQAQEAALRNWAELNLGLRGNKLKWYPFEAQRVPDMIIDLKQGTGRLIRTQDDYGVIAILDPRLRSTQYGRRMVLPSLPPAAATDNVERVRGFYAARRAVDVDPKEFAYLVGGWK